MASFGPVRRSANAGGMRSPSSLPSALAFGLVLAVSSSARADEPDAAELAPPEAEPTHVLVHLESPRPVRLESHAPDQKTWRVACGAPCDRELPLADEYRIAYREKGMLPGRPFRLTADGQRSILVKVHPASADGMVGGGLLIGLGGLFMVASALSGVVAILSQPCGADHATADEATRGDGWCGDAATFHTALLISGAGVLAATGSVVGGVLMIQASSRTSTTQRPDLSRGGTPVTPRAGAARCAPSRSLPRVMSSSSQACG